MKKKIIALLAIVALAITACAKGIGSGSSGSKKEEKPSTDVSGTKSDADNESTVTHKEMNVSMFNRFLGNGGNFLYSPFSLKDAFSIIYGGMSGVSKAQVDSVLGLDSDTVDFYKQYEDKYTGDNKPVKVANLLVVNDDMSVNTDKLRKDNVKGFHISSGELEDAVDYVNKFVEDNTAGKIDKILEYSDVDEYTILAATNALYFKQDWQFLKSDDYEGDSSMRWGDAGVLYKAGRITSFDADMKNLVMEVNSEIDVVKLPYKTEKGSPEYSMYLIIDSDKSTEHNVRNYLRSISDSGLATLLDFDKNKLDKKYDEVSIVFPMFTFSNRASIKDILRSAGVIDAFSSQHSDKSDNLDFIDIHDPETDGNVAYIGNIFQATYIDVTAEGTEASAATSIVMEADMAGAIEFEPPVVKYAWADSPFAYIIKDDTNDVILFMGFVEDLSTVGHLED